MDTVHELNQTVDRVRAGKRVFESTRFNPEESKNNSIEKFYSMKILEFACILGPVIIFGLKRYLEGIR